MTVPTQQNCQHQGEGWCLECVAALKSSHDSLKSELVYLKAALPKTKDGVTVLLGMELWEPDDTGSSFTAVAMDIANMVSDGDGGYYPASECYRCHPETGETPEEYKRKKEGDRYGFLLRPPLRRT